MVGLLQPYGGYIRLSCGVVCSVQWGSTPPTHPQPEHGVPGPGPGAVEVVEPAPERVACVGLPRGVLAYKVLGLQFTTQYSHTRQRQHTHLGTPSLGTARLAFINHIMSPHSTAIAYKPHHA